MFPLQTDTPPTTAAGWHDAMAAALTQLVAGPVRLTVDGNPPALASVDVDLTGCWLTDGPPPDVAVVGRSAPGPSVARFHAAAGPLVVRKVPVAFDVSAADARFALGRTAAGQIVVTLADAADGRVTAGLAQADLDAALLLAARAGAAPYGVDVRAVQSRLTATGPRDLAIAVDLTAKKFVTFTLRVTGRLSVDETMTATATGLGVQGSGMAATFAAGILRTQLAKLEGQRLPLLAVGIGNVKLRDVAVDVSDGLRVAATFGGTA
jgi:hypothetical protein